MARIRTIKPDFYSSGKQLRLSLEASYLLPCLWVHADDEGRMVDDPLEIGARCPRLIKKIDRLLHELSVNGWLIRYEHSGKKFIQIHDWKDHQKINHPTSSKIPAPYNNSVIAHGTLPETSCNTTEGRERKGKEGKGKEYIYPDSENSKNSQPKEEKIKYADFVTLTPSNYGKLVSEHGETMTKRMIEILDNYKGSHGKQYKCDYRAILSWVIEKAKEKKDTQKLSPVEQRLKELENERKNLS